MRQKWLLHAGKTLTFARVFAWRLHTTNTQKSWLLSRNIVRTSLKRLAPYYEAPIRHESCQTTVKGGCGLCRAPWSLSLSRLIDNGRCAEDKDGSW
jgi:hypothetical protein